MHVLKERLAASLAHLLRQESDPSSTMERLSRMLEESDLLHSQPNLRDPDQFAADVLTNNEAIDQYLLLHKARAVDAMRNAESAEDLMNALAPATAD